MHARCYVPAPLNLLVRAEESEARDRSSGPMTGLTESESEIRDGSSGPMTGSTESEARYGSSGPMTGLLNLKQEMDLQVQ